MPVALMIFFWPKFAGSDTCGFDYSHSLSRRQPVGTPGQYSIIHLKRGVSQPCLLPSSDRGKFMSQVPSKKAPYLTTLPFKKFRSALNERMNIELRHFDAVVTNTFPGSKNEEMFATARNGASTEISPGIPKRKSSLLRLLFLVRIEFLCSIS